MMFYYCYILFLCVYYVFFYLILINYCYLYSIKIIFYLSSKRKLFNIWLVFIEFNLYLVSIILYLFNNWENGDKERLIL